MMMLAYIRGEGEMRNKIYRQGETRWPIRRNIHRPKPEQEATCDNLKEAVERAPQPMRVQADWILVET